MPISAKRRGLVPFRRQCVGRQLTQSRTDGHSLSVYPAIRAESAAFSALIRALSRPHARLEGDLAHPDDGDKERRPKPTSPKSEAPADGLHRGFGGRLPAWGVATHVIQNITTYSWAL